MKRARKRLREIEEASSARILGADEGEWNKRGSLMETNNMNKRRTIKLHIQHILLEREGRWGVGQVTEFCREEMNRGRKEKDM